MEGELAPELLPRWCRNCHKEVIPTGKKRKIFCPECNSITSKRRPELNDKEEEGEDSKEDFSKSVVTNLELEYQNIISELKKGGFIKDKDDAVKQALKLLKEKHFGGEEDMDPKQEKSMAQEFINQIKEMGQVESFMKLMEKYKQKSEGKEEKPSDDDFGITKMIEQIEKAKQKAYMSKMVSGLYGFSDGEGKKDDVKDKEVEGLKQQLKELRDTIKKQDEERKRELERERMDKKFEALQKQMLEMGSKKDDGSTFEKLFMFDQKNRLEIDKIKEANESERKKIEAELQKERDERFRQEISRISEDFKREIGQRMTQDGFSEALKDKMQKQILEKVDVEKIITGKDKEGGSVAAEIFANTARELSPALKSLAEGYAMKQQSRAMGGEPQMVDPNALTDSQIAQFSPDDQARIRSMRGQGQQPSKGY